MHTHTHTQHAHCTYICIYTSHTCTYAQHMHSMHMHRTSTAHASHDSHGTCTCACTAHASHACMHLTTTLHVRDSARSSRTTWWSLSTTCRICVDTYHTCCIYVEAQGAACPPGRALLYVPVPQPPACCIYVEAQGAAWPPGRALLSYTRIPASRGRVARALYVPQRVVRGITRSIHTRRCRSTGGCARRSVAPPAAASCSLCSAPPSQSTSCCALPPS